jgi:rare lipoprotein A
MSVRRLAAIILIGMLVAIAPAAAHSHHKSISTQTPSPGAYFFQTGLASFYGTAHDGKRTASGRAFNQAEFTAAHPWLPFGTVVRVTNLRNRRMVKVTVTDRGPHAKSRAIDVSSAAARELGMQRRGVARVRVEAFNEDQ